MDREFRDAMAPNQEGVPDIDSAPSTLSPERIEHARNIVRGHLTKEFLTLAKKLFIAYTSGGFSTDVVDDILQKASLQAVERAHQFEEGTDFKKWFMTIIMNLARRHYTKRETRARIIREDGDEIALTAHAEGGIPPDMFISIASAVRFAERMVDPVWLKMLLDVAFYEMTYDELATKYGVAKGTVMSRLSRARKALREGLEREVQRGFRSTPSHKAGSLRKAPGKRPMTTDLATETPFDEDDPTP